MQLKDLQRTAANRCIRVTGVIFSALFGLLCAPAAHAQIPTTVVTATVLDPNGIAYSGAQVKAVLSAGSTVQVTNQQTCASGGYGSAPCYIPITGTVGPTPADNTGTFTLGMIPNASIYDSQHNPVTSVWNVTVTITPGIALPFGTGPQTFTVPVTISGATQNISSTLNAQAPCLTIYLGATCGSGPPNPITGLTFFETDTTIVAEWNTATSANSSMNCGGNAGKDNGLWPNSTSHQGIVTGLSPSTGYSCTVTSGATTSTPQTVTTNALQTRIPLSQVGFGSVGCSVPQNGDGTRTFVSNDANQYANQDDGHGFTSVANAGSNMQVGILNNLSTCIGTNVNLLSNYGAFSSTNGTDGPGGDPMSNKLDGIFGLNGDLFTFQYRGDPATSTLTTQDVFFANWMRSNDHGATWNNWQTPSTFNANGSLPSPQPPAPPGAFQFAVGTIASVAPVRYAADDGTYGYTTAGNLIDGANGYVYLTFKQDSVSLTNQYLARILRLEFQAQNASAIQYWSGPPPASVTPAAFVNDSNWTSTLGSAVPCYAAAGPIGVSEETFVSGLNRYLMIVTTYGATDTSLSAPFNPATWAINDGVTPCGPWTSVSQYTNSPLGFYTTSIVHNTVAGNSATSNIPAKMTYATFPTPYETTAIPLTLLPASPPQMQQLQQYSCTPVETPISNGGTWATISVFQHIQSISGTLCEVASTAGVAGAMFTAPPVTGDTGGTWPADQMSEAATFSQNSTGANAPGVRMDSSGDGYAIDATGSPGGIILAKFTAGTGGFLASCVASYTATKHDSLRITAVGTTITGYLNGVEPAGCTATDSSFTTGNPGMFLDSTSAVTDIQVEHWDGGANQAATPVFSTYAPGFSGSVTLTCPTSGSTGIFYTTNGTQPTHSSTALACGGSVTVTAGTTILRAFATATDMADSNPTLPVSY